MTPILKSVLGFTITVIMALLGVITLHQREEISQLQQGMSNLQSSLSQHAVAIAAQGQDFKALDKRLERIEHLLEQLNERRGR